MSPATATVSLSDQPASCGPDPTPSHCVKKRKQIVPQTDTATPELFGTAPSVTFIHSADWQLGMRRNALTAETQGRFAHDRIDAIATLMQLAAERDAAFVVVAGDVFDDNLVDRTTVRRALDTLRRSPQIPVFLLPGNHDPLDPTSVYTTPTFREHCPEHVTVLTDTREHAIGDDVVVIGAPWRTKSPAVNPLTEVAGTLSDDGKIRIVVAHGGVDTISGGHDAAQALLFAEDLDLLVASRQAQYIALGDRHSTTSVGATGRIWFSGAPEPTSPRETDPGNVLEVTASRDHIDVTAHRVGRWQFLQSVVTIDSDHAIDTFITDLTDPNRDSARTVLRVAFDGVATLAQHARLTQALDDAADLYALVHRWERHDNLVIAPDQDDLDRMNLTGFVADAFDTLRNDASTDPVAADALALMYGLAVKAAR